MSKSPPFISFYFLTVRGDRKPTQFLRVIWDTGSLDEEIQAALLDSVELYIRQSS